MRKYFPFLLPLLLLSCMSTEETEERYLPYEETAEKVYDNYLDAPDSIFNWAKRIKKEPLSDSVMIYCDMMEQYTYDHSDEKKVFKGAILAAKSRLDYQINTKKDEKDVLHYFNESLETSRKYRYDLTLYQTYYALISYYQKNKRLLKSKQVIDRMFKEAEKTNTPYGLFEAHRQLGTFYMNGNKKQLAVENLRKAIDISYEKHNIANAEIYFKLCELLGAANDTSLVYAEEALTRGNGKKDSLQSALTKALIYAERDEWENSDSCYAAASAIERQLESNPHEKLLQKVLFYQALHNHQYGEARRIAEETKDPMNRTMLLVKYAEYIGDDYLMLTYDHQLHNMYDSINDEMDKINIDEMQVAYNDRRTAEILQLENNLVKQRSLMLVLAVIILCLILIIAVSYAVYRAREAKRQIIINGQLQDLNDQLTLANASQKRFLQNMSHEIRTPLNAICGFSALLADKDVAPQLTQEMRDEYAKLIGDNTELMLSLVDDILVMGDIEKGKYKMNVTSQFVHRIIESSMSSIRSKVAGGVELRYDNLLPADFAINTDLNRMRQVVLNFLTNACKHTTKGEIVITTVLIDKKGNNIPADTISSNPSSPKLDGAMLQIAIINTGDPIPRDKAEVIFQRFEKLDDFKQGTGLGLPICREIANLFNGKVYLDTTYTGIGNRFVFEHALLAEASINS